MLGGPPLFFLRRDCVRRHVTPTVATRFIFAGDSNIDGGYVSNNNKMDRRAMTILGLDYAAAANGLPLRANRALGGQKMLDAKTYNELTLSPPTSIMFSQGDTKILVVGTGTNDFFSSPPAAAADLIARYDALVDFYKAFPNFYVLPMTTLKASSFGTDIDTVHASMMTNWQSYGWDGVVDAYRAGVYPDDYLDGSPGATVHILEKAHVKCAWLIAAAISNLGLSGTGALPSNYWVLDKPTKGENDSLYTAINNALVAGGHASQAKIANSDGVRNALACVPSVMRAYALNKTFQDSLITAFGSLDPLNQLIDVKTLSTSLTTTLPGADGWP